ncbi:MAG TPA: hypothetical protein PLL30_03100 [Candidatus Krumholzibacteria bacterium]|nr:hypothetical protein [Candidatus Krumholzibacteria bacterium]HPD70759.1 hypothetical protein [Candidatus Krumholzibacteria bacterium]HRY39541.1 hypothetical protein [Candidatus Krumholzibacteria bacterium]
MKKMLLAALLASLLLPAAASATRLTDLDASADCLGWSAEIIVRFRAAVFQLDLDYTVVLSDDRGNPLEVIDWAGSLTRAQDTYPTQRFQFYGEWTVTAPPGQYHVDVTFHTAAPFGSAIEESELTTAVDFFCAVVPTESTTWSSVKSLYR